MGLDDDTTVLIGMVFVEPCCMLGIPTGLFKHHEMVLSFALVMDEDLDPWEM